MFINREPQDYYAEAIKDARVNHLDVPKSEESNKIKLIIINLFFILSVGGYFGYGYLQNNHHFFKKTSVMGVTYTSNDENKKLEALLKEVAVDDLDTPELNKAALREIVDNSSSNSPYIASLNAEIRPKRTSELTIVVHDGDTLRTLANRYYGDPLAYTKILKDNPVISRKSNKIYAGQIIKLQY